MSMRCLSWVLIRPFNKFFGLTAVAKFCLPCHHGVTVVQEVEKSFSNQKVASSFPCRSVLEQPLIAPDVQCAISVNVKCVYIVSRFG